MNRCRTTSSPTARRAFTLLELQVAIVLLAFGIATLGSLLATQSRVLHRVRGDFKPDATLYLTQPNDPWVRQLGVPARVTSEPLALAPAETVGTPLNNVVIITTQTDLTDESITVDAEVTPK
jgi:hypothetical protein